MAQEWWANDPVVDIGPSLKERSLQIGVDTALSAEERARKDQRLQEEEAARKRDKDARDRLEWEATHNPDGSPKTGTADALTEAQKAVDKEFATDYVDWAIRGGRGDFEKSKSQLEETIAALDDKQVSGPILGLVPDWIKAIVAPDAVDYPEQVQEVAQRNLRAILGGQFAQKEGEQLLARAFNPKLDEATNKRRVQRLLKAMKSAGVNKELAADYYEKKGTLAGFVGQLPSMDSFNIDYETDDGEGLDAGVITDDSPNGPSLGSDSITRGGPGGGNWYDPLVAGVGDIVESGVDIAGIVANPLNATVNAATGSNLTTDLGGYVRDDLLGIPRGNKTAEAINQTAASALGTAGLARLASKYLATGGGKAVADVVGRTPIRDTVAGAGAGAGGVIGEKSGIPGGEFVGALVGGVGGYGAANRLDEMAARYANRGVPRELSPTMKAADRLGIELMPADVGGVGTRMASGAIGRTLGGIPMAEGAKDAIASAARAKSRVADRIGFIGDDASAGQAAQKGAKAFMDSSALRAESMFDNIPVPDEKFAQLDNTRTALAEVIQGFKSNPKLSPIWTGHPRLRKTLEALTPVDNREAGRNALQDAMDRERAARMRLETMRGKDVLPERMADARSQLAQAQSDIADAAEVATKLPEGGQLSWQDMKRLRSIVGEIIGQPSLTSDGAAQSALRKFYGALTTDMETTAAETGPRALTQWKRANQYWRGRQDRIDNVLSGLLGNKDDKNPEAAFAQINRWAGKKGGDFGKLSRAIRSLPEEEANTVRATIVNEMGVASPGRQNADGLAFSPAEFATQWSKMSDRAKSVLFPNKRHRQDLNDLSQVMSSMKKAGEYANFSNTALGVNATAQGYGALVAPLTMSVLAAGQFGAGKLLASPRFARALATSAKMPPEQAGRKLTEQLGVIAAREPLMANDAKALQQYLQDALSQSPGRAAAEDETDARREPPQ